MCGSFEIARKRCRMLNIQMSKAGNMHKCILCVNCTYLLGAVLLYLTATVATAQSKEEVMNTKLT